MWAGGSLKPSEAEVQRLSTKLLSESATEAASTALSGGNKSYGTYAFDSQPNTGKEHGKIAQLQRALTTPQLRAAKMEVAKNMLLGITATATAEPVFKSSVRQLAASQGISSQEFVLEQHRLLGLERDEKARKEAEEAPKAQARMREEDLKERKNRKRLEISARMAEQQRAQIIEDAMAKRASSPKESLVKQNWIDALNRVGITPPMSDENGEKMTLKELEVLAHNRGVHVADLRELLDNEFRKTLEAETKPPRFVAVPDSLLEAAEAEAVKEEEAAAAAAAAAVVEAEGVVSRSGTVREDGAGLLSAEGKARFKAYQAAHSAGKDPAGIIATIGKGPGAKTDPRQPTPDELAEALKALGMTATPATDLNKDEIAAFKKAGIYSEESVERINAREARAIIDTARVAQEAAPGVRKTNEVNKTPAKKKEKSKQSKKEKAAAAQKALKSAFFTFNLTI